MGPNTRHLARFTSSGEPRAQVLGGTGTGAPAHLVQSLEAPCQQGQVGSRLLEVCCALHKEAIDDLGKRRPPRRGRSFLAGAADYGVPANLAWPSGLT